MDSSEMTPLNRIQKCIRKKQNFVLNGGAGSGKTETLKQVLEFISKELPDKKIVCITHTNLAVEEIVSRVGNHYTISTIHSFLNALIRDYKVNIHQVIFEIFKLERVERKELAHYENDEKTQKKVEHDNFKKLYIKYAKKLFALKNESLEKVTGKREYDKNPVEHNSHLNSKIDFLNNEILKLIQKTDYNQIRYNETRFDSLKDLTFGHDNLLTIASLLFEKYELLGRIFEDKFDFVFIDEYQDTNKNIIDIFLNKIPDNKKTIVGLFGDSMRGIYDDGVGDVDDYIKRAKLIKPAEIETKGVSVELDLKKKKKENEKLTLQVSELEYKLGIIKGDYILKAETETSFAIKIGALEAGLKFLGTTKAIDYAKALKDDPTGKAWIDMFYADIDELLHEFGNMDELNIIIEKNGYAATA